MAHTPPEQRDLPRSDDGKAAALAGWALYILSIPSANLLVLV
jgi:hypothetical protein